MYSRQNANRPDQVGQTNLSSCHQTEDREEDGRVLEVELAGAGGRIVRRRNGPTGLGNE